MSEVEIGNEIAAYITQIPFTTTIEGYTGDFLSILNLNFLLVFVNSFYQH